jgi:hypothetical protein
MHIEWNSILAQNALLHNFQEKLGELPLYVCIRGVQQKCVWTYNMWCIWHNLVTTINGKRNVCSIFQNWTLQFGKPEHPVWKTEPFDFSKLIVLTKNIHHWFQASTNIWIALNLNIWISINKVQLLITSHKILSSHITTYSQVHWK